MQILQEHNMGVLNQKVGEVLRAYRGRREENIREWELLAIRERIDDIVEQSPFAGELRILVGFDQDGTLGVIVWPEGAHVASA